MAAVTDGLNSVEGFHDGHACRWYRSYTNICINVSFIFCKRTSFYSFVLLIMVAVKTLYSRAILVIIHETWNTKPLR